MRRPFVFAGAALLVLAALAWLFSSSNERSTPGIAETRAPKDGPVEPGAATDGPRDDARTKHGAATGATGDAPPAAKATTIAKAPLASGQLFLQSKWGGKPGEFGRKRDEEANPEAPMAIVAAGGQVLVTDQVNHRVQRFDANGKPLGSIPISETVQDLAVQSGGRTVALDRLADKNIQVYDSAGKLVNEASILGKGLEEGGAATGVFADDEGIWIEREHGSLVRVADPNGNADSERTELPGRPTRDGKVVVSAAILDKQGGRLAITTFDRATLAVRWMQTLTFRMSILQVVTVDSDAAGNVFAAVHLGREGPTDPFPIVEEVITVVKLDPSGQVAGSIELPVPAATGDEMMRPIAIADDGSVYRMAPGNDGMTIERFEVR